MSENRHGVGRNYQAESNFADAVTEAKLGKNFRPYGVSFVYLFLLFGERLQILRDPPAFIHETPRFHAGRRSLCSTGTDKNHGAGVGSPTAAAHLLR